MFKVKLDEKDLTKSVILTDIPYLQNPDFLCIVGSHLYGTESEGSDMDIRGFSFLPKEYLIGVKKFDQHQNLTDKEDTVVWSADKFVRMLLNGTSIAFEMLHCPSTKIIRCSLLARNLLANKQVYFSQRTIKSILGYATSEWRKVLGETTRDLGAARKKHIEDKGYSYKNAYHAIRIINSGRELTNYGRMFFPCENYGFLKALKVGDVKFEDVEPLFQESLKILEEALPHVPKKQDIEFINDLLVKLNLKKILTDFITLDF